MEHGCRRRGVSTRWKEQNEIARGAVHEDAFRNVASIESHRQSPRVNRDGSTPQRNEGRIEMTTEIRYPSIRRIRNHAVFGRYMALLVLCLLPYAAQSQSIQCMSAVQQLQLYAQQVQAMYNQKGMPIRYGCMQQCGGNMWCQQQCEATYAAPLNQWYAVQVQQVNLAANRISRFCLDSSSEIDIGGGTDDPERIGREMDEVLEDLEDIVEEEGQNRDIRIDIPEVSR